MAAKRGRGRPAFEGETRSVVRNIRVTPSEDLAIASAAESAGSIWVDWSRDRLLEALGEATSRDEQLAAARARVAALEAEIAEIRRIVAGMARAVATDMTGASRSAVYDGPAHEELGAVRSAVRER